MQVTWQSAVSYKLANQIDVIEEEVLLCMWKTCDLSICVRDTREKREKISIIKGLLSIKCEHIKQLPTAVKSGQTTWKGLKLQYLHWQILSTSKERIYIYSGP